MLSLSLSTLHPKELIHFHMDLDMGLVNIFIREHNSITSIGAKKHFFFCKICLPSINKQSPCTPLKKTTTKKNTASGCAPKRQTVRARLNWFSRELLFWYFIWFLHCFEHRPPCLYCSVAFYVCLSMFVCFCFVFLTVDLLNAWVYQEQVWK